jgi:hypothetical protein
VVLGLGVVMAGGAPVFIAGATALASVKTAPKAPLLADGDLDDASLSKRPNRERRRRRRTLRTPASFQVRPHERGVRTPAAGPPGFHGPDAVAVAPAPLDVPAAPSILLASNLLLTARQPVIEALYLQHCSLLI